jgi:tetratricopeptide (TPR) repeat protein
MSRWLSLALIPLAVGCSFLSKKAPESPAPDATTNTPQVTDVLPKPSNEAPEVYRTAVQNLEGDKHEEALKGFDDFVRDAPTSPWMQAAIINSGRALEGLGRWTEASERYRAVIRASSNSPKLQAMALYRLSFCHEALGEDQQTVATLADVMNRRTHLPREVARAELPARVAAAYARVGNFGEAVKYYKEAQAGIGTLRSEGDKPDSVPEWLPRTLYYMGSMPINRVNWASFETVLRPLAHAQIYLMQAAEVGAEPWASKASKDLIAIYRDLWRAIETAPVPEGVDPVIARRETQSQQWDRAYLVLGTLEELKARMLIDNDKPTEPSKQIVDFSADLEKRLQALIDERPIGEGLTAEAERRRASVRGRVVNPDSSLEKQFLRESRTAKPLPGTQALPDKTETPAAPNPALQDPEDPNL